MSLMDKIANYWREVGPSPNYYFKNPQDYGFESNQPKRYNSSFSVYKINPTPSKHLNNNSSINDLTRPRNIKSSNQKIYYENEPVCIKHLVRDKRHSAYE